MKKDCRNCQHSFYDASFRRRYCLKLKQVLSGDEAETCKSYISQYQDWLEPGGEKWKNVHVLNV